MGLFKSISKAVKKVVKAPLVAAGLDSPDIPKAEVPEAPAPAAAPIPTDQSITDTSADTVSNAKKRKAAGKKSLSVSRGGSGSGINL